MKNVWMAGALTLMLLSCNDKPEILTADDYFEQGKFAEAISIYNDFIKFNPQNMKAFYNRGRSFEELGDVEKAVKDFEKVVSLDENHIQANISLAVNEYFRTKDYSKTIVFLNNALDKDNSNTMALTLRGKAKQRLGDFDAAMKDYNAAISIDPDFANAYFARGSIYVMQNRRNQACVDFKTAARLGLETADDAVSKYCN